MAIPNVGEIKTALSTLSELVKKGMTVEAQEKIMDLRELVLELREQNIEYRETIEQLEKRADIESSLFFESNVLWLDKDNEKVGPFCQPCWDAHRKLVHLQSDEHVYYCKVCGDRVLHTPMRNPVSYL